MLLSLSIKNAALITSLKLDFHNGLNVLSGETGAGKSIIIDSLSFALGSKADKSLIRHGENLMSAEAVFDISKNNLLKENLQSLGIEYEDTLILYRTMTGEGRGEIRINGRAVTLSALKEISSRLVDIYGQSEHISLLKPQTHIELLDDYAKKQTAPVKEELANLYANYRRILSEIKSFGGNERERERLIELYRYQIEEIEAAKLSEGEEEELLAKRSLLINAEKISEEADGASKLLSKGEYCALKNIADALSLIGKCEKYDPSLSKISERLASLEIELEDISDTVSDYINSLEYDPAEADKIEKRLDLIKSLKRKYGKNFQEIMSYLGSTSAELERLEGSSLQLEKLNRQKEECEKKLYELSLKLSDLRKTAAKEFETEVLSNLFDLSMKGSTFKAEFSPFPKIEDTEREITSNGMDNVEFFISPNKGEPLKPLAKIISGGEMSRFMLAIKNIISETDGIGTLIFDEIDSGISGVTATAVAKKFASISRRHQLIAITHLPQIAAMADSNYLIKKQQTENSTTTTITRLNEDKAIEEIARLIGAAELSVHASMHAKELIAWSGEYKKSL